MTVMVRAADGSTPVPAAVLRPSTLDQALRLLTASGTAPLGGGVDWLLRRREGAAKTAQSLVCVGALPELGHLTWPGPDGDGSAAAGGSGGEVVIGGGVKLAALAADERLSRAWPILTEAAGSVATGRIRRLVTLAGNIAAGHDSHDPPVALTAAGALLTLRGMGTTRTLPVERAAERRPEEIIQDVRVPAVRGRCGSAYEKFLVRGVWEYACVNVGAVVQLDDAGTVTRLSVAVGSVAGGPVAVDLSALLGERIAGTPGAPAGQRAAAGGALVAEAARRARAATRPYGDVRGSAAYKSHMIGEFTRRALMGAIGRALATQAEPTRKGAHR